MSEKAFRNDMILFVNVNGGVALTANSADAQGDD